MAELSYYPDAASRLYNTPVRRRFASVGAAVRETRTLPSTSTGVEVRYDSGTLVPSEYVDLIDAAADVDADAVVTHRWSEDGWAGWRHATVNPHNQQAFAQSIVGRRGRVTGTANASGGGNKRSFFLYEGTRWADSEIVSLWWGPSTFVSTPAVNRPQMGHVHGAYVGDDGRLRAAVAWYNIFGGPNPEAVLIDLWESDGASLYLGGTVGGAGSLTTANRTSLVLKANRYTFGVTLIDMYVSPHWAADALVSGSTGVLAGMAQSGLNGTHPVQGGAEGGGLIRLQPSTAADLADNAAGGTWTPDYPWRVFPYWVRSRWVPPVMSVKQWPYGRPEPDWGGPHSWSTTVTKDADTLHVPDRPGYQGIMAAHAWDGSYAEWGDVTMGRAGTLPAAA